MMIRHYGHMRQHYYLQIDDMRAPPPPPPPMTFDICLLPPMPPAAAITPAVIDTLFAITLFYAMLTAAY